MTALDRLAREVDTSGRSLRRAADKGLIRCSRLSERRVRIAPGEEWYVRRHWRTLSRMLSVLRTQSNVRLAVLYGSLARGEQGSSSDADILVRFDRPSVHARALLADRLEAALGRRVQLVDLSEAQRAPLLLADILRDGRVLVDRDRDWAGLKRRERSIRSRARRAEERLDAEVAAALRDLEVLDR